MLWVLFVFLSYQDRNVVKGKLLNDAHGAENESKDAWFTVNRTLCAKMSVLAGGIDSLYQVSDGRREVRSVVNTRGDLVDCSVIADRVQVKSFLHLCRLGLAQQDFHGEHLSANNRFARMEEAMAACGEFTQRSELMERRAQSTKTQPWPRKDAPVKRSKRGFTYPGTLWCGAGNMADNDDHLGDFAETDSCCRTHDHCPHVIHAFSSNYGYTNFKLHSISHCDCDIAMKQCLRKVNDTASRVVGQAFFNVIGAPCFEFVYEDHCVERHWYGLCKRYERLPVAVPQPAVPYDFGGVDIIDVLTVAPPAKTSAAKADDGQAARESTAAPETPPPRTGGPATTAGGSSLVTMVTAAEDFIKVLATVSTSQGSPADTAKGVAPGAQAKKKTKKKTKKKKGNLKNSEKRKMSQSQGKKKGKGRGRKGKPHPDSGPERVLGASGHKAGARGNSLAELKTGPSGQRNHNRFAEGGLDLAGLGGPSNEVMKDEPAAEKDAAEATPPPPPAAAPKRQVERPVGLAALPPFSARLVASTGPTAAVPPPHRTRPLTARKGERRRRKKTPGRDGSSPPGNAADATPGESPSGIGSAGASTSPGAAVAVNPAARLGQKRPGARSESESSLAVNQPKRNRSGEGTVGRRQKKGRRLATVAAIVPADHKVPTEESGNAAGSTAAPTALSTPPTERPGASRRPETYGAQSATGVTPAPSRSAVKTKGQRLKGPGRQRRRGRPALSPSHGNPLLQESRERMVPAGINALFRMRATATAAAAATAAAVARPSEQAQHPGGRERQRAGAGAWLAFSAATQRPAKGDTTRKKTPRCPAPCEATRAPGTLTPVGPPAAAAAADEQEKSVQMAENSSFVATTSAPALSPRQRSIQRVQQQFDFKKRRKELLLLRQP